MKHIYFVLFLLLLPFSCFSQELLADVVINYSKVQGSNTQVYKTLQKSLKDFINNTSWTGKKFAPQERVKCSFGITIEELTGSDNFKATLLIQSSRPVFNSTYYSPILNYVDNDFRFNYVEYENLVFNENRFSGKNLIDVVTFYVYLILGYDADTFSSLGGSQYFLKAKKIADNSTNQGFNGWSTFDGDKSRGSLIADLISDKSNTLRQVSYQYHRMGLDNMAVNEQRAKNNIAQNLLSLGNYSDSKLYKPLDIFLNSKKEEISNMFSAGQPITSVNITELTSLLQRIAPIYTNDYWNKIKS